MVVSTWHFGSLDQAQLVCQMIYHFLNTCLRRTGIQGPPDLQETLPQRERKEEQEGEEEEENEDKEEKME